jgi:hypothetical protein
MMKKIFVAPQVKPIQVAAAAPMEGRKAASSAK